jgi:UDP-glucose 4-epimerase
MTSAPIADPALFDGRTLLVTGGTGSFGNVVTKRLLQTGIKEIRIFSRDEKKQDDQRQAYNDSRLRYYIGDVRDRGSVANAMPGVDYVFHAAALKQVPSCEFFPMEALKTNVIGTANVLDCAIAANVSRMVCLSTDKAVYPINAMGMSKALMEKVMVAKSRGLIEGQTVVCGTRYGNVMASRGSVIPLFVDQLLAGKPITITDPNMTRYMMTLEDAVDLVYYAFANGKNGDIFVQKAPASTIDTLAKALIALMGNRAPNAEVRIIGTRHGEKLHETLLSREEMAGALDEGEYFRVQADMRELKYDAYFSEGDSKISRTEDYNSGNTQRLDVAGLTDLLMKLPMITDLLAGQAPGTVD